MGWHEAGPYAILMTCFISRDLLSDSEFRRLLLTAGWQVTGYSLVELSPLSFGPLPSADWIFFSSQNAVHFFFQHVEKENLTVPAVRWAALGAATAKSLANYVGKVDFIGSGDPATTAMAFGEQAAGSRVLFPGARHSQQSVQNSLHDRVEGSHLEVYDNQPVADPAPRTELALVFTSPMNAQAYLSHHALQPGQRVIAIGATTAAAITALRIPAVITAAAPTETALAAAVLVLAD